MISRITSNRSRSYIFLKAVLVLYMGKSFSKEPKSDEKSPQWRKIAKVAPKKIFFSAFFFNVYFQFFIFFKIFLALDTLLRELDLL